MTTRIIPPRVALVDPRTGGIAREWYLYLLSLTRDVDNFDSDTFGFAPLASGNNIDVAAAVQDAISLAPPLLPIVPVAAVATPSGSATINITGRGAGQFEWSETVAATGLVAGSRVFVQLAPPDNAQENDPEMLDIQAMSAACLANDTLTVTAAFATPTRGPIGLLYGVM